MNAPIPFPAKRAKADLGDRPLSECLEFWAGDLRRRGLVAEASYLDAALITIQLYERERKPAPGAAVWSCDGDSL